MAFVKKTWVDRVSENPHRRSLTNVSTGTVQIVDVERYEGVILEEGDPFNAANMNDLEDRIEQGSGGMVVDTTDIPVADRIQGMLYFFH